MKRNFLIPKPDYVVIGVDFGQGDAVVVKTIFKESSKGITEIVSVEVLGKVEDFDTEEKINEYIEKL